MSFNRPRLFFIDNTAQGGSDTIATDDVTTLNGAASTGVKVPRSKIMFGVDGVATDASATNPLPVLVPDNTATGTLASAAQTVVLIIEGKSAAAIVISGTWAGTITFEGSVDGTIFNPINAVAASTSTPQSTTTVNGLFRLTPAGLLQVRVIMTAFTSGTATVTMRASAGTGGIFANQIVPVTLIANPAEGVVSLVNSSVTALAANAVFTGTSEDVTNYSSITVSLISNVASATDGLSLQQSPDGTNWDLLDVYTVPAATGKTFSAHISSKFYRLVYTNGASLQGSFRLQTIYHKYQQPAATVRPQDGRPNDNDFGEELSFLMGYNSLTNAWNRIGITNAVTGGNENLVDRIKVNAALRMIDNVQPSGSKLVNVTGSQALGMDVNMSDRAARILGVVTQQPLTKGTQGANGITTQDLKDAGRSHVTFYTLIPVLSTATDTLQSLTATRAGATVAANATPAVVTTAKTFRVTKLSASYIATATSGYAMVRLRFNAAGAVAITSPVAASLAIGAGTPATANSQSTVEIPFPDGMEFAAGSGLGISVQGFAAVTATAVGYVLVSVIGYEY